MLPEELFLSLCRLQPPGAGLVPLGSRGLGTEQPSFARCALMGPGRRRPSHAQSCFPTKENTLGVGFRLRRTPTKQQGPGSQRQPSPALPDGEQGLFAKSAYIAFQSKGTVWACLCSARSVSCHFADCSSQELCWCSWGDVASVLSDPVCLGGHCCG